MPGFGQNGSVAWVVVGKHGGKNVLSPHQNGFRGKIDDPPVKDFLVKLRFPNAGAAEAAWTSKGQQTLANGEFVVTLKVPAQPPNTNRTHENLDASNEPNVNPPWEIGIDWEFVSGV
jgi:hypothetical protein